MVEHQEKDNLEMVNLAPALYVLPKVWHAKAPHVILAFPLHIMIIKGFCTSSLELNELVSLLLIHQILLFNFRGDCLG